MRKQETVYTANELRKMFYESPEQLRALTNRRADTLRKRVERISKKTKISHYGVNEYKKFLVGEPNKGVVGYRELSKLITQKSQGKDVVWTKELSRALQKQQKMVTSWKTLTVKGAKSVREAGLDTLQKHLDSAKELGILSDKDMYNIKDLSDEDLSSFWSNFNKTKEMFIGTEYDSNQLLEAQASIYSKKDFKYRRGPQQTTLVRTLEENYQQTADEAIRLLSMKSARNILF